MHNIAIAVKSAMEPMFGNALMTAMQSSQNKQWIKKARKVYTLNTHSTRAVTLAQSAVACFHIQICPETALNQSNATCDVLQRCSGFRLIYLHYSSVQNKLEFKLASLSALEDKIQRREQERGGLDDQARQKVPSWTCLQSLALTTM